MTGQQGNRLTGKPARRLFRLKTWMEEDLWQIPLDRLHRAGRVGVRLLRVGALVVRGFARNQDAMRASSLTFYSLLSIVPVAALAFSIAKGFGFEKRLETELLQKIPGHEQVLIEVIGAARAFIENTKGGVIAGIGVLVLFWSVIKVLGHIEASFNHIWHVKKARSPVRKFTDYLSLMLVGPLLFIMSGSVTVFISSQVTTLTQRFALLGVFSPMISAGLKLTPFFLTWILFTIAYMVMPNTRVRFPAGILAGVVGGTVYQLTQTAYLTFQFGVARYNAVYGSFAALPLLLVWLQLSWMVVLLGAEIAYAAQNADRYAATRDPERFSQRQWRMFALRVVQILSRRFAGARPPATVEELSYALGLSSGVVSALLEELAAADIVIPTAGFNDEEPGYQPAQDIGRLTPYRVLQALSRQGEARGEPDSEDMRKLAEAMDAMERAAEKDPANRPLGEIGTEEGK
jgi:membrane protein